jgi:tetratricopeptide (TPR) repeat protein
LLALADELSALGDWDHAWQALGIASQAAQNNRNLQYLAEASIYNGILQHRRGNLHNAIEAWEDALARFLEMDQAEGTANCHVNLGAAYKSMGELDKAGKHLESALNIYRRIDFRKGQSAAFTNLGLVYRDSGHLNRAVQCFEAAIALDRELGDIRCVSHPF